MKFERAQTLLLEPFAVCGILLGLALVGLRILSAVSSMAKETEFALLKGSVIGAAAVALIYGAFALRAKLKESLLDRVLYAVVIAIFASIILAASFLM